MTTKKPETGEKRGDDHLAAYIRRAGLDQAAELRADQQRERAMVAETKLAEHLDANEALMAANKSLAEDRRAQRVRAADAEIALTESQAALVVALREKRELEESRQRVIKERDAAWYNGTELARDLASERAAREHLERRVSALMGERGHLEEAAEILRLSGQVQFDEPGNGTRYLAWMAADRASSPAPPLRLELTNLVYAWDKLSGQMSASPELHVMAKGEAYANVVKVLRAALGEGQVTSENQLPCNKCGGADHCARGCSSEGPVSPVPALYQQAACQQCGGPCEARGENGHLPLTESCSLRGAHEFLSYGTPCIGCGYLPPRPVAEGPSEPHWQKYVPCSKCGKRECTGRGWGKSLTCREWEVVRLKEQLRAQAAEREALLAALHLIAGTHGEESSSPRACAAQAIRDWARSQPTPTASANPHNGSPFESAFTAKELAEMRRVGPPATTFLAGSPVTPATSLPSTRLYGGTAMPVATSALSREALASARLDGETHCVDEVTPAAEGDNACGCWPPPSLVHGRHCEECEFHVVEPPPASPPASDADGEATEGDSFCAVITCDRPRDDGRYCEAHSPPQSPPQADVLTRVATALRGAAGVIGKPGAPSAVPGYVMRDTLIALADELTKVAK